MDSPCIGSGAACFLLHNVPNVQYRAERRGTQPIQAIPSIADHSPPKLISRMDNISHWSCTNEPGVTKYALTIPRGGGDNLTAYSIEQ